MLKQTVDQFAGQMLGALLHAGPRPGKEENNARAGWIDDVPFELWDLLNKYHHRLEQQIFSPTEIDVNASVKQCINVANAAMMLADVLQRRAATSSTGER